MPTLLYQRSGVSLLYSCTLRVPQSRAQRGSSKIMMTEASVLIFAYVEYSPRYTVQVSESDLFPW